MIRAVFAGRGRLWRRRPGLRIGVALCVGVLGCGCDRIPGDDSDNVVELEEGEVRLAGDAQVHEVLLSGIGGPREMEPARVQAQVGDAVAFESGNTHTHSIIFSSQDLTAAQDSFLEATSQLRGPPLVSEGTRWIVSFEGAPTGEYPFSCLMHGGQGSIQVAPATASES